MSTSITAIASTWGQALSIDPKARQRVYPSGLRADGTAVSTSQHYSSTAAVVSLSEEAATRMTVEPSQPSAETEETDDGESEQDAVGQELSDEEQQQVRDLETRDREVRAHEAAHMSASGGLAGGATYSYQVGPDGKRYAVSGEVSIDTSPGSTAQETLSKARLVRAAALAPSDPSPQDLAVASEASRMETEARQALTAENETKPEESTEARATGAVGGPSGTEQTSETPEIETGDDEYQPPLTTISGHMHSTSSCGFCKRAVAAYAS